MGVWAWRGGAGDEWGCGRGGAGQGMSGDVGVAGRGGGCAGAAGSPARGLPIRRRPAAVHTALRSFPRITRRARDEHA